MKKVVALLLTASSLIFAGRCLAFSAVAGTNEHVKVTSNWSYNYATQKEADASALEGCKANAKRNGMGKLAKQCRVFLRAKAPGFGSYSCGDGGCAWALGYGAATDAMEAAYSNCSKQYRNCDGTSHQSWKDYAGFPQQVEKPTPTLSDRYDAIRSKQFHSRFDNNGVEVDEGARNWMYGPVK